MCDGKTLLLWGEKNLKGRQCRHCRTVHRKKYGKMTLRNLVKKLEEPEERERFDSYLKSQVELTKRKFQEAVDKAGPNVDLDALRVRVRTLLENAEIPEEKAKHVHRTVDSSKRRGKWFRLDVFNKRFPAKSLDASKLVWKTDRSGHKAQWTKVYNDEEGIEDFSEGSEDAVDHITTLDKGDEVLDDDQVLM